MLSLLYLGVKARQYFVSSSCMFLEEKTLLKIWLNPGINFRGTVPWAFTVSFSSFKVILTIISVLNHSVLLRLSVFHHGNPID